MSLVGNLEDLSLPDILQIVSLSQKSGILTIEQEGRQGQIYIRAGRVIQTVSPRTGKTLGEILTGKGLIRPDDLEQALEEQRTGERKELLGSILVRKGHIEQQALEKVVQKQIEESIVYFLTWREGTFSFELCDIEGRGEVSVDPHAFILEQGIDTQWLVLEGTRLMDERKKSGTLFEEDAEPGAAEESAAGTAAAVIVVDDDAVFLQQLSDHLSGGGLKVTACEGAAEALEAVKSASSAAPTPAVVTDIVYPTSDGTGFLGGLELIEQLRKEHPEIAIVAITAYPDDNVRNKVDELGVKEFLIKPAGGDRGEKEFYDGLQKALSVLPAAKAPPAEPVEEMSEAEEEIITEEQEAVPAETEPAAKGAVPLEGDTLVDAIGEKEAEIAKAEKKIEAAGLDTNQMSLLQDMMVELQGPNAASEIGLLILRFAAEVLNRAVLFMIKGGAAVGLGGFGIDVTAGGRKGGVKGIRIPLDEESLFREVVTGKGPCRGPVASTPWNDKLMQDLGGETPDEYVVIPLVASGKVRVVLYGDNLPEKSLPNTQALEIFLAQAGLTLERVFLEKQLQEGGSS